MRRLSIYGQLYGASEDGRPRTVFSGHFRAGITRGRNLHKSKWEFFTAVPGHGLIGERKTGTDQVMEFEVSGEKIRAVHMLPGYAAIVST